MLTSKILRIFPLFRQTAAWGSRWNQLKPCEDPQETGFFMETFTETWVSNSLGLHGAREPHDTRKGNAWYPSQGYLKRISFRSIFVPDSEIKVLL